MTDKIGATKLNEILLNSMPTSCSKHAYVKGFDCEYINLKKYVNMFERMEIAESIYKDVVEPSYKNSIQADANRDGHSRHKRGESALS